MSSRFVSSGTILGDGTSKPIITPAAAAGTSHVTKASAAGTVTNKDEDGNATLKAATQSFASAGTNYGDAGVSRQLQQESIRSRDPAEEQQVAAQQTHDTTQQQEPPPEPLSIGPAAEDEDLDPAALARRQEWASVQATLLSERAEREAKRKAELQGEGEKSLFAILQENKAAKQAAFEEANKIRNQFRALDDDEIDFLDEVEMKKREAEDRKREEEREGMRKFQEAQKGRGKVGGAEGDGVGMDGDEQGEEMKWEAGGRKRKREKEGGKGVFKGLKRKESAPEVEGEKKGAGVVAKDSKEVDAKTTAAAATTANKPAPSKASLVAYGSDSDDD